MFTTDIADKVSYINGLVRAELYRARSANDYVLLLTSMEHTTRLLLGVVLTEVRRFRTDGRRNLETSSRNFIHDAFLPILDMLKAEISTIRFRGTVDREDRRWVEMRMMQFIMKLYGMNCMDTGCL